MAADGDMHRIRISVVGFGSILSGAAVATTAALSPRKQIAIWIARIVCAV
jgi:hypothetical protein